MPAIEVGCGVVWCKIFAKVDDFSKYATISVKTF